MSQTENPIDSLRKRRCPCCPFSRCKSPYHSAAHVNRFSATACVHSPWSPAPSSPSRHASAGCRVVSACAATMISWGSGCSTMCVMRTGGSVSSGGVVSVAAIGGGCLCGARGMGKDRVSNRACVFFENFPCLIDRAALPPLRVQEQNPNLRISSQLSIKSKHVSELAAPLSLCTFMYSHTVKITPVPPKSPLLLHKTRPFPPPPPKGGRHNPQLSKCRPSRLD